MQNVNNLAFETESWADRVASACIERYHALPRAGKPGANEWAPLAGVVVFIPATLSFVACEGERFVSKARESGKGFFNKARDNIRVRSKYLPAGHVSFTVSSSSSDVVFSSSVDLAKLNVRDSAMSGVEVVGVSSFDQVFHKNHSVETNLQKVSGDESTMGDEPLRDLSTNRMKTPSWGAAASKGVQTEQDTLVLESVDDATEDDESRRECSETSLRVSDTSDTPTTRRSPKGVVACVALGTGSKCLGGNELVLGGARVHDSHAEVLARRGFLRYLLHQADRAFTSGDSDVLEAGPAGCRVRPGVSFHAFVSEPPCGDAAIFPSDEHEQRAKERLAKRPREEDDQDSARAAKRFNPESPKAEAVAVAENIEKEGARENRPHEDTPQGRVDSVRPAVNKALETGSGHKDMHANLGADSSHCDGHQLEIINFVQSDSQGISQDAKQSDILSPGDIALNSLPNSVGKTVAQESSTPTRASECKPRNAEAFASGIETTSKEITQRTMQTLPVDTNAAAQRSSDVANKPTDVHRTGAKCVGGGAQDRHAPKAGFHVTGAVRTKPGRGDPTLSLSCSDKMARWHAAGVQGALVSLLLPSPLRFRSVVHAGGVTWSAASLRRAVAERACADAAPLALAQASLRSPAGRGYGARPCAGGIVWCDAPQRPHEVVARGFKQGVTKKAANTSAGRLKICRKEMAQEFIRVYSSAVARYPRLGLKASRLDEHVPDLSCEILSLESLQSKSDAQNCRNRTGVSSLPAASAVSEDQCRNLRCQNRTTRQSQDQNIVSALNSNANVGNNVRNGDKCNNCLADEDLIISSAAISQGFDAGVKESRTVTNCGRQAENGESVAERLRKMTYAQLKAMACDYQRRWRHVRESHFPGWTPKPSGLQQFVVGDE